MSTTSAPSLSPARLAVLSAARDLVDATAPDPAYLDAIAPTDPPERQLEVAKESGCILISMAVLRAAFQLEDPEPYKDGSAPGRLEKIAQGVPWGSFGGAFRAATLATPPQPGDLVWYDKGGPSYPQHVETICEVSLSELLRIACIAGGERDGAGNETVRVVQRALHWDGGHWTDIANGRPVMAVIDADLLAGMYALREAASSGDAS
jgi:hypothetical protein